MIKSSHWAKFRLVLPEDNLSRDNPAGLIEPIARCGSDDFHVTS